MFPTGCGMKILSCAAVPSPAWRVTNLEGHSSGSVYLSFVAGSLTWQGLSRARKSPSRLGLLACEPQRDACLSLPSTEVTDVHNHALLFKILSPEFQRSSQIPGLAFVYLLTELPS